MRLLPLLLLTTACTKHVEAENPGIACYGPVEIDEPLRVDVIIECTSGDKINVEFTCQVTRDGDAITVESLFVYDDPNPRSTTLDCVTHSASCSSDPLEEGLYTVAYGVGLGDLFVPPDAPDETCVSGF